MNPSRTGSRQKEPIGCGIDEFLGLWEKLHNHGFKGVEFDAFVKEAGSKTWLADAPGMY